MSATKKGRPQGAKNRPLAEAEGQLTRCPKCGSTNREPYFSRVVTDHAGLDPATGLPYTAVVHRRTACSDCGQHRVDRHLVNDAGGK